MRKKLSLDVDALRVSSFSTSPPQPQRGTVIGADTLNGCTTPPVDDCTCANTCACPSAYYWCNTNPVATAYSCHYTKNASCLYA